LFPVTINFWTNYIIAIWDLFVAKNPFDFAILDFEIEGTIPFFKSESQEDYRRFRSLMQIIDLLTLDVTSFNFDKRHLALSAVYIQLGTHFEAFTRE
jgi:hypothetical protein